MRPRSERHTAGREGVIIDQVIGEDGKYVTVLNFVGKEGIVLGL